MGYTAKDTQKMVTLLTDAMADRFQAGTVVSVMNFGNFEVKKKMERILVNPSSGQRMLVPPKLAVGFRPSVSLKWKLKNGGQSDGE